MFYRDPYAKPPHQVQGLPTRVRMHEVTSVNPDGTVNTRLERGRSGAVAAPVPGWYVPQVGDRVLVIDLDGDPQQPVVITPFSSRTGTPTLLT